MSFPGLNKDGVPHQFESITEKQWKDGESRYRCAVCRRDYSNSIHLLLLWPLVVTLEDVFVPNSAAALIKGLRGLDDESLAVTITLWAMDAEMERNLN